MSEEAKEQSTPRELFTAKTFGTLGGCVMAVGVVTTVFSSVFDADPKKVGLLVSVAVAFVPVLLKKKRHWSDHVVAPFNGCLIFLTLVGASSFYPYVNDGTASVANSSGQSNTTSAFRPWVPDRNLVEASQSLATIAREQNVALNEVSNSLARIESRTAEMSMPAPAKLELNRELLENRRVIESATSRVSPTATRLKKLGIRP
jgi:hypothetical protein